LRGRDDGQQSGADAHQQGAAQNAQPSPPACLSKLIEKEKAPQDAEQAVRIPQRKRDAESNIADRENGHRVGHGPEAAGEDGPENQMWRAANVHADGRRAEEECGQAPAREKHANHHDQGDDHRRNADGDELRGSFGGAKPRSRRDAGENAERLELSQAGIFLAKRGRLRHRRGWHGMGVHAQRIQPRRINPPIKTATGTQKCVSVSTLVSQFRGISCWLPFSTRSLLTDC
jgi:hypothetical protein